MTLKELHILLEEVSSSTLCISMHEIFKILNEATKVDLVAYTKTVIRLNKSKQYAEKQIEEIKNRPLSIK